MNPKIQNYINSKDISIQSNELNNYKNLKIGTIFRDLILMGYSIDSIACCYNLFHFSSVSEAVYLMSKDPETNFYIHHFVPMTKKSKNKNENIINVGEDLCVICKDKKKYHNNFIDQINNNNNNIISNNEKKILSTSNNTINNESKNNMIINEEHCINNFLIPKNSINSRLIPTVDKKLIEELSKTFDNQENLCFICCDTIMNDENSYIFPCKHQFCKNCISHYLISEITKGNTNIHCLIGGCPFIFTKNLIANFTPKKIFTKYCFLTDKINSLKIRPIGCIPCVYPDCQEWVKYNTYDEDPFVICPFGHSFCALCKGEIHKGKMCAFQELKHLTKKNSKIKLCPRCHNLMERKNSNIIKCSFCGYKFCWLCLREYTKFHYFFFNVYGCPGLQSSDPETSYLLNNGCLSICFYILSIILFLIVIFICVGLYIFFGAIYELIVWYNLREEKKIKKQQKMKRLEIYNRFLFENMNVINGAENNQRAEIISDLSSTDNEKTEKKTLGKILLVVFTYLGLVTLGIIAQPLLLVYKVLEYMAYFWKRFKCFYFCFRFNGHYF